jgi:hypothetical protein
MSANVPHAVQQRIKRGIQVLDACGPENWRGNLDSTSLDIRSSVYCVLGQLYGHYEWGMSRMPLSVNMRPEYYGFSLPHQLLPHQLVGDKLEVDNAWSILNMGWREALAA